MYRPIFLYPSQNDNYWILIKSNRMRMVEIKAKKHEQTTNTNANIRTFERLLFVRLLVHSMCTHIPYSGLYYLIYLHGSMTILRNSDVHATGCKQILTASLKTIYTPSIDSVSSSENPVRRDALTAPYYLADKEKRWLDYTKRTRRGIKKL